MEEKIPRSIIERLQYKYPTPNSRKDLRLNENLIEEILEILEDIGFKIVPVSDLSITNFSATSLDSFETTIKQWIQIKDIDSYDIYLPSEQILRDLISYGWSIVPPKEY